jgi:hypothetical protein
MWLAAFSAEFLHQPAAVYKKIRLTCLSFFIPAIAVFPPLIAMLARLSCDFLFMFMRHINSGSMSCKFGLLCDFVASDCVDKVFSAV